jgi:hypothetical protein
LGKSKNKQISKPKTKQGVETANLMRQKIKDKARDIKKSQKEDEEIASGDSADEWVELADKKTNAEGAISSIDKDPFFN